MNARVKGAGPPLLFLGGSSFDLSIRAPVFDSKLVDHFTVAAADPRGLGLTDAPDGDWAMQDYARDALDLIDALCWGQCDVLGESFGAMTALHLAALAPERINRLALCAGSSGGQGGRSYPIHEFKTLPDASARARAALTILDSRFVDFTAQKANELIDARMAQDAAFLANHSNRLNHDRLLAARADHDAWDALPIIDVPTLVFGGRYDQQSPPDRASTIASRLPNSTLRWIEGGHSICFGSEDTVEQILGAWT